jgi:hypothetical protein
MYRRLVIGLLLLATSLSAHAADPLERQQREAFIHKMVTACKKYDEAACYQIIEKQGMSPFALYTAFFYLGDIELQRGEREAAQSSYRYALQWASRMQNGGRVQRAAATKLTALNAPPSTPSISEPPSTPTQTPSK